MSVEDVARKMLELKILPRFMMLVFTGVYMYCIFCFTGLSVEETTAERAAQADHDIRRPAWFVG